MLSGLQLVGYWQELRDLSDPADVESLLIEVCEKVGMPELYSHEEIIQSSVDNESDEFVSLIQAVLEKSP